MREQSDGISWQAGSVESIEMMAKRARADVPENVVKHHTDTDAVVRLIDAFGTAWTLQHWRLALGAQDVSKETVEDIAKILERKHLTSYQVSAAIWDEFMILRQVQQDIDRQQLCLRSCKQKFIDAYKELSKSDVLKMCHQIIGSKTM